MSVKQDGNKQFPQMPPKEGEEVSLAPLDVSELVKTILQNMPKGTSADDIAAAIKAQNSTSNKHQAHNLTVDEMKKVKQDQMNGTVEMIPANKISKFKIPAHEKHLMHYSTENTHFDGKTGEKISKPRFHVSTVQDFIRMSNSVKESGAKINPENAFAGLRLTIYHDMREGMADGKNFVKQTSPSDLLDHMTEEGVRKVYTQTFGEEPLPSDSKVIMIGLIKEKWQTSQLAD